MTLRTKTPLRRKAPMKRTRMKKRGPSRAATEWKYGPKEFREWIHQQPCCLCGVIGFTQQAHVGKHGMGKKLDWTHTVPLCGPWSCTDGKTRFASEGCHQKFVSRSSMISRWPASSLLWRQRRKRSRARGCENKRAVRATGSKRHAFNTNRGIAMASIGELAAQFRSWMSDPKEAAKAAQTDLEPPPASGVYGIGGADYSIAANDSIAYITSPSFAWSTTTIAREEKPVTVPAQPEAHEVAPTLVDNEAAAYRRTCQAIGYDPAALVVEDLLAFMAEKKIRRYDNDRVNEYLKAKAKKELGHYGSWFWSPLRESDKGPETKTRDEDGWSSGTATEAYQKAIPLRVLARVEQFMQKFGDKVRFLVSDYAVKKPDPFIAVVPKQGGVEPIVFDVWDEPDFK